MNTLTHISPVRSESIRLTRTLLLCGVVSSIWYLAINVYVPTRYEGYEMSSWTVSELSAIDAPTRTLWVGLVVVYILLFAAFGWGIIRSSDQNRYLRMVGWLIIGYSIFNFYWPPMHQRGLQPTTTDTLHLVWAAVTVLLMITIMGLGAAALNVRFRIYTFISIGLHILFGGLTSVEAPQIPLNGPTPYIGLYERINIGVFMIWVVVFAIVLIQRRRTNVERNGNDPVFS